MAPLDRLKMDSHIVAHSIFRPLAGSSNIQLNLLLESASVSTEQMGIVQNAFSVAPGVAPANGVFPGHGLPSTCHRP